MGRHTGGAHHELAHRIGGVVDRVIDQGQARGALGVDPLRGQAEPEGRLPATAPKDEGRDRRRQQAEDHLR